MSQRVKTSARALVLTRSSQPANGHLRKKGTAYPSRAPEFHQVCISGVRVVHCYSFFPFFLDVYLEFDDSGQLSIKIYDKRNDFNFKIINFPNMCSNIPASPAYGAYISQLIRYARVSSNYSDFLKLHLHLRNRLLTRAIKRLALVDLLKSLYSDTMILSKYIPSLQRR